MIESPWDSWNFPTHFITFRISGPQRARSYKTLSISIAARIKAFSLIVIRAWSLQRLGFTCWYNRSKARGRFVVWQYNRNQRNRWWGRETKRAKASSPQQERGKAGECISSQAGELTAAPKDNNNPRGLVISFCTAFEMFPPYGNNVTTWLV